MDCEKFEAAMIDELYDELDELTSAAAKRHMASCTRCSARLGGLRATRRVLSSAGGVPLVDPPNTLEDRILAATREAQKVVPFRRRLANAVSTAGSWAMRPQTQMAAVFLLMIGTSVVFLRGGQKSAPTAGGPRDQGAPAASVAQLAREESLDTEAAKAAHGALQKGGAPTTSAFAAASPLSVEGSKSFDARPEGRARAMDVASPSAAEDTDSKRREPAGRDRPTDPTNAGAIGGAANYASRGGGALSAPRAARPAARADRLAAPPPSPPGALAPAAPAAEVKDEEPQQNASAFDAARQLLAQKNYVEATRQFDALAQHGDTLAELWAARSVRDGSGCGAAVGRYDGIVGRQGGSSIGNDALLEAGQCYRTMGDFEVARARLVRLLTVPSHMARAQRELDAMSPKATTRAMPRKAVAPTDQQAAPRSEASY
jgi:hypothetical protein